MSKNQENNNPPGQFSGEDEIPLTSGIADIKKGVQTGWTGNTKVEKVAENVKQLYLKKGKRYDTYFYKVVLGGNVKIAGQVIDCIKDKGGTDILKWLLDTGDKTKTFHAPVKRKGILLATQIAMFALLTFISTILTPLFYAVHGITASIVTQRKRRLAANIKLPLAYAAFCQNDDIMRLFLTKGVDVENTDNQGNNVFHYIADLSSESPERAIEIFKSTVTFINDSDVARQLLAQRRNSASLTAIEYTSKFGSPALLTQMLNHPNLLQHTAFAVSKDDVLFNTMDNQHADRYQTKLEYVDVSMYEAGSITKKSTILNLLSDREITEMSLPDLELFDKYAFVGKWMALKTKQMLFGIVMSHTVDLAISIFTVFLIAYGYSAVPLSNQWQTMELKAQIKEIEAQGMNHSLILKDESYRRILKKVQYDHQLEFMREKQFDEHKLHALYNKTLQMDHPTIKENGYDISNLDISNNISHAVLNVLYGVATTMEEFSEDYEGFRFWKDLPYFIQRFATALFDNHGHLLSDDITVANRAALIAEMKTFFNNFTIDGVKPSRSVEYEHFVHVICVKKSYFTLDDLMISENGEIPNDYFYDTSCEFKGLYEMANKECKGFSQQVFKIIGDIWHFFTNYWVLVDNLKMVVAVLALLYIILDLVERWVYIYTCISNHTYIEDMITSVLTKKVPGSYTRKQLNVLTFYALFLHYAFENSKASVAPIMGMSEDEWYTYLVYFLIIGMILRFVMHIHGLRLLPGIGHFVITTFSMGNNLIHFSAIYTIVLFIFAVIFHILVDDPNCPLKKSDGFEDILAAMFACFKLAFGHGDLGVYFENTPVKLTYTIFVIISGLLLMNLIIAIMSATATDIMTDPYKDTLWRVEWLDEALSVEFTASVLALPFSRWCNSGYWSHKRAGYDVRHDDKQGGYKYKVFIEVFHCPALK